MKNFMAWLIQATSMMMFLGAGQKCKQFALSSLLQHTMTTTTVVPVVQENIYLHLRVLYL